MYLLEGSNSHQSFSLAPFDEPMFKERHEGFLRHSSVHPSSSYTVYVPSRGHSENGSPLFRKKHHEIL